MRRKHRNAGRAWGIAVGSRKIVARCASTKKNIRMSATSCEPWPWSGVPLRRCVPFTFWINPTWFQSTCQMLRHTSYVHLVCMVMKAGLWLVIPCRSLSMGVVKAPHCKKIYSFAKFASLFNCVFAVIVLRFAWHRSTVIDLLVSLLCVKPSNPSMYGKLSEGFGSSWDFNNKKMKRSKTAMRLCFWGTLCGRTGLCRRGALWARGLGRARDITKSGKAKFHRAFHHEFWSILCGLQRPWYLHIHAHHTWKMTTCISLRWFMVQIDRAVKVTWAPFQRENRKHVNCRKLSEPSRCVVASLRRCAASSRHHLLRWPRPGHLGEGCWGAIHGNPEMQIQQRCKFKRIIQTSTQLEDLKVYLICHT